MFAKTKIFAKYFAKTFAKTKISMNTCAKILLFGIIIFWPDFFTIFWQKFSQQFLRKLKLMQKCSRNFSRKRKFSRKLSRKLPHFRMIFAFCENEKNCFRFNPSNIVNCRGINIGPWCCHSTIYIALLFFKKSISCKNTFNSNFFVSTFIL
jgi:hypothetical protein